MKLHQLKNDELNSKLKSLVHQEREILSEILHHIAEVDRRRLYLEMAYPNLFTYLTEYLGYSAGSAQRRMDAARLMRDTPNLPEKLETGELNLAQVSLLQKALRQKKRESRVSLTPQSKSELLESLCGQSLNQSAEILARELDLELKSAPQIQVQKDKSVRFEITLSEVQWQKLQKARELLSHSLPHGNWDQVLERLCDRLIHQKTKIRGEGARTAELKVRDDRGGSSLMEIPSGQGCTSEVKIQKDRVCTSKLKVRDDRGFSSIRTQGSPVKKASDKLSSRVLQGNSPRAHSSGQQRVETTASAPRPQSLPPSLKKSILNRDR